MSDQIPNEWHKEYPFNCLTKEQFEKLQKLHRVGDEFSCGCDECGVYLLDIWHRCTCGNRRCYFVNDDQYSDPNDFWVELD